MVQTIAVTRLLCYECYAVTARKVDRQMSKNFGYIVIGKQAVWATMACTFFLPMNLKNVEWPQRCTLKGGAMLVRQTPGARELLFASTAFRYNSIILY